MKKLILILFLILAIPALSQNPATFSQVTAPVFYLPNPTPSGKVKISNLGNDLSIDASYLTLPNLVQYVRPWALYYDEATKKVTYGPIAEALWKWEDKVIQPLSDTTGIVIPGGLYVYAGSGDVNQNGYIDNGDYILINRHIAQTSIISDKAKSLADVNGDGKITAGDVMILRLRAAGLGGSESDARRDMEKTLFPYSVGRVQLSNTVYDVPLDANLGYDVEAGGDLRIPNDKYLYFGGTPNQGSVVGINKTGEGELTIDATTLAFPNLLEARQAKLLFIDPVTRKISFGDSMNISVLYEPKIGIGTSNQYWNGSKQWINFPSIPAAQVQSNWTQTDQNSVDYIQNKPTLFENPMTQPGDMITNTEIPIAISIPNQEKGLILKTETVDINGNSWVLPQWVTPGYANYDHLHTGVYEPTITPGTTSQYWRGDKSWVAFPSIPAAQIQSDWDQTNNASLDYIKNKPTISSANFWTEQVGATNNIYANHTENVGIGITAPTSGKLHVYVAEGGSSNNAIYGSGWVYGVEGWGNTAGVRSTSPNYAFMGSGGHTGIKATGSSLGVEAVSNTGTAIKGTTTSGFAGLFMGGNVGVGESNPVHLLSVKGTSLVTGDATFNSKMFAPNLTTAIGTAYCVGVDGSTGEYIRIPTPTSGTGTVTSVSGTAPVSVATGTTTPVISMAAATGSVPGYLTAADWTTFNSKGSGTVTSVGATSPVESSGGNTPTISIAATSLSNWNAAYSWGNHSSAGYVPSTRTLSTTSPLAGGGDLSANRTFSIAVAGATSNGYLTSTDWNTFNSKGSGTVTGVTGTAPVVSSGGSTPAISMAAANGSTNGYLTSADWTTFNSKGVGTVTSVSGTAPVVSSGGATPAISMAAANTSTNGYLTSTDWNTFNSKASATWLTNGSKIYYNAGNVGVGESNPGYPLSVKSATTIPIYANATSASEASQSGILSVSVAGKAVEGYSSGNYGGHFTSNVAGKGLYAGSLEVGASPLKVGDYYITVQNSGVFPQTITGGVTSVSGTSPIASSGGTTPAISISQANGSTNGYLSSTDWSTFNNKVSFPGFGTTNTTAAYGDHNHSGTYEPAISKSTGYLKWSGSAWTWANESYSLTSHLHTGVYEPTISSGTASQYWAGTKSWVTFPTVVYDVSVTAPITMSGTTHPSIGITQASGSTNGYITSSDYSVFNNKVTSVSGTAPIYSSGGTTPFISISQASGSTNGYLSSTDWNTFNNKGSKWTSGTGDDIYREFGDVGMGTTNPLYKLHVIGGETGTYTYGTTYGIQGISTTGYGVYGSGNIGLFGAGAFGVQGVGSSVGLFGQSTNGNACEASSTNGHGGYFTSAGASSRGLYAQNTVGDVFYFQGAFTNPASQFIMKQDGKLGVGTSTPTTKLDVNGTVRVGSLTAPGAQPNFVITEGANGVLEKYPFPLALVSIPNIGDYFQGGKVFYILTPSDYGYEANKVKGLIASTSDILAELGVSWGCQGTTVVTDDYIGSGFINTGNIIGTCNTAGIAAELCYSYVSDGYIDWYLPSVAELEILIANKNIVGGFTEFRYWSSSQYNDYQAYTVETSSSNRFPQNKSTGYGVRPVRTFIIANPNSFPNLKTPPEYSLVDSNGYTFKVPYVEPLWVRQSGSTNNAYSIPTGNIGIGVTEPKAKLSVYGKTQVTVHGEDEKEFLLYDEPNDLNVINYNGTTRDLYFQETAGNIGIGITSPLTKFQVQGSAIIGDWAGGTGLIAMPTEFGLHSSVLPITLGDGQGAGNSTLFTVNDAQKNFTLMGGDVGIGSPIPSAKLDVLADSGSRFKVHDQGFDFKLGNTIPYPGIFEIFDNQGSSLLRASTYNSLPDISIGDFPENYNGTFLRILDESRSIALYGNTQFHTKQETNGAFLVEDGVNGGNVINYNGDGGDLLLQERGGEVGIRTTNPNSALDVNGVITATGGNSTQWNDAVADATKDYGFLEDNKGTLSFNPTDSTLTLTPATTIKWFSAGVLKTISIVKTKKIPAGGTGVGTYYFYFDAADTVISVSSQPWTLNDTKIPIAYVMWNKNAPATYKYWLADERHSNAFSRREHLWAHSNIGSRYTGGGQISATTVLGSASNANNQFKIAAATIMDEDMIHTLAVKGKPSSILNPKTWTMFYRTNSTTWAWDTLAVPYPYVYGDYIQYDNAGTLTASINNRYVNSYVLFTNLNDSARFVIVPGRASFTSAAAANSEDPRTFDWTGYPIAESVILYRLTWQTNAAWTGAFGNVKMNNEPMIINQGISSSTVTAVANQWVTSGNNIINTNSGNVGINTSNPQLKLDVNGSIGNSAGDLVLGYGTRDVVIGDASGELFGNKLTVAGTEGTSYFENGNVGFGITNPSYQVDVTGTVNTTALRVGGYNVSVTGNCAIPSTSGISAASTALQGAGIWTPVTGTYASATTFTFTGTAADTALIKHSLFTCTNANGNWRKMGYVKYATLSSTTVTVTVVCDSAMVSGATNFKIAINRKVTDYEKTITIPGEAIADASNPQGLWFGDFKCTTLLLPVDASLRTAASGAGAALTWNIYHNTTAMFSSAPDMTTNTVLRAQAPTTTTNQVAIGETLSARILSSAGATTKGSDLQLRLFLVPLSLYTAF